MKIFWLTDIHLDFVNVAQQKKLLNKIVKKSILLKDKCCVVVTGDIGNSSCVIEDMLFWKEELGQHNIELYFVLGNHDYYGSSIEAIRFSLKSSDLKNNWLNNVDYIQLNNETALVGHDGWYDGGYANWFHSKVFMADYTQIFDLNYIQWWSKEVVFDRMNALAKEGAEHVYASSVEAIKNDNKIIYVATHIPPFRENSVYNNMISDDDWMPHFSSKHMGDMLLKLSTEFKDVKFVVLCGHSHGEAKHIVPPNMVSYTSKAVYRNPCISRIFNLENE